MPAPNPTTATSTAFGALLGRAIITSVDLTNTRRSAEEMALKQEDSDTAVVKATEVMIAKP